MAARDNLSPHQFIVPTGRALPPEQQHPVAKHHEHPHIAKFIAKHIEERAKFSNTKVN